MVVLSKEIFDRNVCKETPCSILHLWSSSCIDGLSVLLLNVFIGCVKFFGPIYIQVTLHEQPLLQILLILSAIYNLPFLLLTDILFKLKLLLNWKKINKKYVRSQFIAFLRTITYGISAGGLFSGTLCVLMNFNFVTYYNALCAGIVAGLSILIESEENKILDTLLLFNQVLEAAFNVLLTKGNIKRRHWKETLAFMCISSFLMYLFKTQDVSSKFTHLWFYPGKSIFEKSEVHTEVPQISCSHKNSCFSFAYQGSFKYFCMGYTLEMIKNTLPRLNRVMTKPKDLFFLLYNKKNLLFGLFFGGYTFLYRSITCYLFQKNKGEVPSHALIAGLIAGTTYYFRPNIQISIIGFTTVLQLLWLRLRKKYNLPYNIPYTTIIFILTMGFLMHTRFHLDDYCPKYTRNMINMVTNSLAGDTYNKFVNIVTESDKYVLKNLNNLQ